MGSALRFVSKAVMVGFINAVGVNIVLGQLANFTGHAARVRTGLSGRWPRLIVALERTRVGALGLVVAIVVTSAAVEVFG